MLVSVRCSSMTRFEFRKLDQPGVIDKSPGDCDTLLLPAAKFGWPVPASIAQSDCFEQLQGAPVVRSPARNEGQESVFESGQLREQIVGLEDDAHAFVAVSC